jgi:RISC-loading complex subunit TARBP2
MSSKSSSSTKSEKTKKVFNQEDLASLSQKTPVSILQEICLRKSFIPRYDLVQIEGAVHRPTFKYRVTVGDLVAVGSGATKQKAKHYAATAMIENLKLLSVSNPENSETVAKVVSDIPSFDDLNISMPDSSEISGNPVGSFSNFTITI